MARLIEQTTEITCVYRLKCAYVECNLPATHIVRHVPKYHSDEPMREYYDGYCAKHAADRANRVTRDFDIYDHPNAELNEQQVAFIHQKYEWDVL